MFIDITSNFAHINRDSYNLALFFVVFIYCPYEPVEKLFQNTNIKAFQIPRYKLIEARALYCVLLFSHHTNTSFSNLIMKKKYMQLLIAANPSPFQSPMYKLERFF